MLLTECVINVSGVSIGLWPLSPSSGRAFQEMMSPTYPTAEGEVLVGQFSHFAFRKCHSGNMGSSGIQDMHCVDFRNV
jgi:hypothetical protein